MARRKTQMLKRSRVFGTGAALALAVLAVAAPLVWGHRNAQGGPVNTGTNAAPTPYTPVVAITTAHDAAATESEVRWILPGSSRAPTSSAEFLGSIGHVAQGVLRGDATPDGHTAYVIADQDRTDFGAHLFRASAGKVTDLGGGVLHAARPLVAENGFVYVERGKEGTAEEGVSRVDHLTIDELRPSETPPRFRTILSARGFALHLAGEWQKSLVVYRVDEAGGTILLVPTDGGASREIARIPAYARDFSVSGSRLVFSNRAPQDTHEWHIVELSLVDGSTKILESRRDDATAPYALSTKTLFASQGRTGLQELARGSAGSAKDTDLRAPGGPGFYQVVDTTPDEAEWVLSLLPAAGSADMFDQTWIVDTKRSLTARLGSGTERVEVLRIVGSRTGGVR